MQPPQPSPITRLLSLHSKGVLIGQVVVSYSQSETQLDFPKEAAVVQSHPIKSPEQSALHPLPSAAVPSSQTSTSDTRAGKATVSTLDASTTIPSPQIVVQAEVAPELSHVHPGST